MKFKNCLIFLPGFLISLIIIIILVIVPLKSFTLRSLGEGRPNPSNSKSSFVSLLSSRPTSFTRRSLGEGGSPTTSLIATGDIMLGRYVNVVMLQKKDFLFPFLKTNQFTSGADITFGNLEAPIVENCPTQGDGMVFCARPEAIEGIKYGGFDILSIANNHILNHGQEGLENTINILERNNIFPSQSNKLTRYQANNVSFGFLSFDLVTYPNQLTLLHDRVIKSTNEVDVLIVSLHWGNEYQKEPSQWQKDLAHQIIDSGAKVIIGHHPHVTQPVESYNNGLIFYSLGNFVFDQPWSEETKKGKIAKIIFEGKNIKSYELFPIYIQNYCQPHILSASF